MRGFSIHKLVATFRYAAPDQAVARDADRLISVYGARASETARTYSWREDSGVLYTQNPGHWHRVELEIERRAGQDNIEIRFRQSAASETVTWP